MSLDTLFNITPNGAYVVRKFSDISDDKLDIILTAYRTQKPGLAIWYILGFLRSLGVQIQCERICLSLRRIDGLVQALQNHEAIDDHLYSVPRSNYLWHLDGHHKLILWGFLIHSIIDRNNHTVCLILAHSGSAQEICEWLMMTGIQLLDYRHEGSYW